MTDRMAHSEPHNPFGWIDVPALIREHAGKTVALDRKEPVVLEVAKSRSALRSLMQEFHPGVDYNVVTLPSES